MGALQPGKLADIVAFHKDPFTCAIDEVPELRPSFTWAAVKWNTIPKGCSSGRSELTAKMSKLERSTTNLLIRAGATYSMAPDRAVYWRIAIQDEPIVGLAAAPAVQERVPRRMQ